MPPLSCPSVSVVNLKGGVGKTAITVNLGFALAEYWGWHVLIVDIDPQFNATQHLLDEEVIVSSLRGSTIKDILDPTPPAIQAGRGGKATKRPSPETFIRPVSDYPGGGRLDLVPSLLDLSFVTKNPFGKEAHLEKYLQKVAHKYDLILIDCPPTISVLTLAAFNASRYYIIPVTPDHFASVGIPLLEQEVAQYLNETNHSETGEMIPLGVVYTMVDRRGHSDSREIMAQVNRNTSVAPFDASLSDSKFWRTCARSHRPVYESLSRRGKDEVLGFAEEFVQRIENEEEGRAP